jgi:hypothetical protein
MAPSIFNPTQGLVIHPPINTSTTLLILLILIGACFIIITLWGVKVYKTKLYQVHSDSIITDEQQQKRELIFERINTNYTYLSSNHKSDNKKTTITDDSETEITDDSETEITDDSETEITDDSETEITDDSETVITDGSETVITDDSETEIRLSDYTYECSNTPRVRRDRQLEIIKRRARKLFVEKRNITETMRDTKLTYDDMVEAFLYYKD